MSRPQLIPLQPTPELWAVMQSPWRQGLTAFYRGHEVVDPVDARDQAALEERLVAVEFELHHPDVWSALVTTVSPAPGGGRLTPGGPASRGGQGLRDEYRHDLLPVRDGARRRGPGRRPPHAGEWPG
ncbi:hypothetical protein ACFWYW_46700 [Nonomuraea sp. NPDC059023]|uniref:hypothetical protein n=1 Tax=unclassified Nonomuraea TaxID=2593643 RepID=UPI0036912A10